MELIDGAMKEERQRDEDKIEGFGAGHSRAGVACLAQMLSEVENIGHRKSTSAKVKG